MRCLPPIKPSFLDSLGPMQVNASNDWAHQWNSTTVYLPNSYEPSAPLGVAGLLRVRCMAAPHFEPPLSLPDVDAELACTSNGM